MQTLRPLCAGFLGGSILSGAAVAHAQSSAPEVPADDAGADRAMALSPKSYRIRSALYSFPFRNNTVFNYGPHQGRKTSSMFSLSFQSRY